MGLIYVVEDDRNISEIESFALKNSGYDVCVYESAEEFYRAVRERIPSLVLLDIMLPDESGLDITEKIRKNPLTKSVPIILVTAKTTELDKVKGLDIGADDYITKPFGVMELISRVRALLRRSGEHTEEKCLRTGTICLDSERHAVYVEDRLCELTYKEYELLIAAVLRNGVTEIRMKRKINRQLMFLSSLAIAITLFLMAVVFYRIFQAQVMDDLKIYAYALADGREENAESGDYGYIDRYHHGKENVRATVITPQGEVLYDSNADVGGMDNHAGRPEVADAIRYGEGSLPLCRRIRSILRSCWKTEMYSEWPGNPTAYGVFCTGHCLRS